MFRFQTIIRGLRLCINQPKVFKVTAVNKDALSVHKNVFTPQYSVRFYAKGKNKVKEDKGKGKKKNLEINESFLEQAVNVEKLRTEFENAVNQMKETYISQVSLRSTTGSIENLTVNFEGKKHTLIELGQIVRKNPKTVIINMHSFPQAIPSVLKAISSSGMNLNPQQDGTSLFIPVPKVTREYRESLAKNAKAHFIKCRDTLKGVTTKYLKELKKKEKDGLSEDDSFTMSEQIKQLADQYVDQAEKLYKLKETELLGEN